MKIAEDKLKQLSEKEQQIRSAKIMAVLKYSAKQKKRDPQKAALLKKYEDKRGGFKIGEI